MDWKFVSPPKCLSWSPNSTVTILGDGAVKEVKIKGNHKGVAPIPDDQCPHKKRQEKAHLLAVSLHMHTPKTICAQRGKAAICNLKKELSQDTNPDSTSTLEFQPLEE